MSGKGDTPRPLSVDQETFASNWDAIFKPLGHSSIGRAAGSNPAAPSACAGSTPAAPAIYIDAETGVQVTEDWWPGMPLPTTSIDPKENA